MTAATFVYVPPPADEPPPTPRELHVNRSRSDRAFLRGSLGSGMAVLAVMAGVGLFLLIQAWDALSSRGAAFLTTAEWQPDRGQFGIAAVLIFTVLIAVVAVAVALPLAMGTALFITEVAPRAAALGARRDGRPDGRRAERRLRPLGRVLLPGPRASALSRWISTWFGVDPDLQGRRGGPEQPAAPAPTRVHRVDVHRRHRRGDDGHADPVLDHARGLLAGAGRRARGRASRSARRAGE